MLAYYAFIRQIIGDLCITNYLESESHGNGSRRSDM